MKRDLSNLQTIVSYCDGILEAKQMFGDDIEDFLGNVQYQWSTSFAILQIGELAKRLSSELTSRYDDLPWSDIAGMRDRSVHQYHNNDLNRQWNTIKRDIPVLRERCLEIISELES